MDPDVAQNLEGAVDHGAPFMFDAERTFAGDLAKLAGRHIVLSRTFENAGKFCGRDGNDGSCAVFTEENGFRGGGIFEADNCAESGRGKPRPCRSKAGFGEGDGQAAVGTVVGGFDGAFGGERYEAVLKALLGGQVDGRSEERRVGKECPSLCRSRW